MARDRNRDTPPTHRPHDHVCDDRCEQPCEDAGKSYYTRCLYVDYARPAAPSDVFERHWRCNRPARLHERYCPQHVPPRRAASHTPVPVGTFAQDPPSWHEKREPTTSPGELDAIYAQLAREQPHNRLLKERIAERARLRAQGIEVDGRAEVAAITRLMGGKHPMPQSRAETLEEELHQDADYQQWRASQTGKQRGQEGPDETI